MTAAFVSMAGLVPFHHGCSERLNIQGTFLDDKVSLGINQETGEIMQLCVNKLCLPAEHARRKSGF
jgi:hypothetical protein